MKTILTIREVQPLGGYRLHVAFSDGRVGTVDLAYEIDADPRLVFAPLRDPAFFRQFRLEHGTLAWPNGLDLAPEYLYFLAFRNDPALQSTFLDWGYLAPQEVT